VAVVTGASKGIGLAIAKMLVEEGARVVAGARTVDGLAGLPPGVRVNAVSPGPVSTDLWLGKGGVAEPVAKATGTNPAQAREKIVTGMGGFATGRFSTPEEVATLVVLLASGRTKNVTGANYVIDGDLIKTT
jgi:NAD(P)-dependent dehydrogenase (short-subunit alcohol dehydrogenase family)